MILLTWWDERLNNEIKMIDDFIDIF